MNEFDVKAAGWDSNPMHHDRSVAITDQMKELIPLNKRMTALEYGAGTGIASFLLKDSLGEITMMDSSAGMVRIMNEKIVASGVRNLKALCFDLEHSEYSESRFDLIFTLMVLHHVKDASGMIMKFKSLLNPGGYIVIADLCSEDGSFHGEDFEGHKGFNIEALSEQLKGSGFSDINHRKCYVVERKISESETKQFDIFLLAARKI